MGGSKLMITVVLAALGSGACSTPEGRRDRNLDMAEAALAVGDLERAVAALRAARGFDPRDRQVALRLARLHEQRGEPWQALRVLDGLPGEVHEPPWLNLRARLLLRSGRPVEGGRLAAALAERDAVEEATLRTLSEIAVEQRLGVEDLGPLPAPWVARLAERLLEVGEPIAALSWLEQPADEDDSARARLVEALAETAVDSDDRRFVRRVERLYASPESALGLLLRRRSLILAAREAEIARLDARFLARFPTHPRRGEPLAAEAGRQLARGEAERALELADEALTLDGDSVPALIVRGLALESAGRSEEGYAALRTAAALDPDNAVAREALRSSQRTPAAVVMRVESRRR